MVGVPVELVFETVSSTLFPAFSATAVVVVCLGS